MTDMQDRLIDAAKFTPASMEPPDAWIGHLPFAAWLIKIVRPANFVELGTHSGNSYFSFCQAVNEEGLSTKCYAVDTWLGEEHAGYYGEEVFHQVNNYNQEHYADFSRLLRMKFDEAVSYFSDRSIDLLHTDGLHTYEAVKNDFETWLPKLTPGAVVVFHDTNVRERGFGVWALWEELQDRYPNHLEFIHSHGLGILQLSGGLEKKKLDWLQPTSPLQKKLKDYFSALGLRQMERFELHQLRNNIYSLNHLMAERDGQIAGLHQVVAERNEQIHTLNKAVVERDEQIHTLNKAVVERDEQINRLADDQKIITRLQVEAEQRLATIEGSTSWKMTFPLRKLLENHPAFRRVSRGTIKIIWWTITGKLIRRLKESRIFLDSRACQIISVSDIRPDFLITKPDPQKVPAPPEVARPIEVDYSIAVPFGYRRNWSFPFPKLAVICHLFYEDLATEFRRYLLNIPFPFDIFISTNDSFKKTFIDKAFRGWDQGTIEVRITRNCGRDIAPKLICFRDVYDDYEFTLHLHSKKSDHASVLARWRGFLLENLLGSPEIVLSVFDAFNQRPDLGIVASQHFEPVRHWINWGGNFATACQLAKRIGISLSEDTVLDFPSGSMFWARTAALKPLLEANFSFDEFAEETNQIDGTLAHAIERLYYYVCAHSGFEWIKISHPPLFEKTPAIIPVNSEIEFDQFISKFSIRLNSKNLPKPRKVHPTPIDCPSKFLISRLQAGAFGLNLKILRSTKIFIGIVTYNNVSASIHRAVKSAGAALLQAGLEREGRILIVDNGHQTDFATTDDVNIKRLNSQGNVGFGAAQNRLMAEAFGSGADIYIAANPDGAFHPKAIAAIVQMMQAHQGRALIEAVQFPVEHPKPYDPYTFETSWISGACMAIPRCLFEEIGGFDDSFFMYCEDVDLSWRARANGFPVRICPRAIFFHAVTNRPRDPAVLEMIFNSGIILARKWGEATFESWLITELHALGHNPTDVFPDPMPETCRRYADFSNQFGFAKVRW